MGDGGDKRKQPFAPPPSIYSLGIHSEAEVPLGVKALMKLRYIEHYDTFYFTWRAAAVNAHEGELNEEGEVARNLASSKRCRGSYCLVLFAGDNLNQPGYKRGKILAYDEDKEEGDVKLVDIGMTLLKVPQSQMFELPVKFLSIRRSVFKIKTTRYYPTGECSDASKKILEGHFTDSKNRPSALVYVTYILKKDRYDADDETNYWGEIILCNIKNKNVSEILVEANLVNMREEHEFAMFKDEKDFTSTVIPSLATEIPYIQVGSSIPAKICQGARGYNDFHIIAEASEAVFNNVQRLMSRVSELGLDSYQPWASRDKNDWGTLVCARHPLNRSQFYRGKVKFIDGNERALVLFLDTGETYTTDLRMVSILPTSLRDFLPCAIHCGLPVLPSYKAPEDFMKRFMNLNNLPKIIESLIARVYLNTNGFHLIDIYMSPECTTFTRALMSIGHADWNCVDSVKTKVEGEKFKEDYILMLTDRNPSETMTWRYRARDLGIGPDPSVEIKHLARYVTIRQDPNNNSPFHFTKLPKLPPTSTLVDKKFSFNRAVGFSILAIMDKETGLDAQYEMEDMARVWYESGQGKFLDGESPAIGDVVVFPISSYHRRGIVEHISENYMVKIRGIETGMEADCQLKALAKPSPEIMKYPLFVHYVRLFDVPEDIPVLPEHFRQLRIKTLGTAILTKLNELNEFERRTASLPTVVMHDLESGLSLSDRVIELAVWKWRFLYRGMLTTLSEIVAAQGGFKFTAKQYLEENTITKTMKKASVVLKILYTITDMNSTLLHCVPLDPLICYQNRTVHKQMTMYLSRVIAPNLTPEDAIMYDRMVCIKQKDMMEGGKSIPKTPFSLCTWHRAFYNKVHKNYVCLDCLFRVNESDFDALDIVPLSPDFYEACPGAIILKIDLKDKENVKDYVKGAYPKGQVIFAQITSKSPKWGASETVLYFEGQTDLQ